MSFAQPAPEASRVHPGERRGSLTPPLVPRLREYRVVPLREHRKTQLLRTAFYALCFIVGIAAGLWAARALQARAPASAADQPVVTIRTLR